MGVFMAVGSGKVARPARYRPDVSLGAGWLLRGGEAMWLFAAENLSSTPALRENAQPFHLEDSVPQRFPLHLAMSTLVLLTEGACAHSTVHHGAMPHRFENADEWAKRFE